MSSSPGVVACLNEVPIPTDENSQLAGGPGLLFDLENVQVLKGPQGTLFGRNSVGGAILLQSARPTNEFGGSIQATYDNYNDREVDGAVNIPIVDDQLLTRIAFAGQLRDGFTHLQGDTDHPNGIDADNRADGSIRLTVVYRPVDGFQNESIVSYSKYDSHGSPWILTGVNPNPATGCGGGLCPAPAIFPALYTLLAQQQALGVRTALPVDNELEDSGSNLSLNNITRITLNDSLTFRNIFGYDVADTLYQFDLDGTPLPILENPSAPSDKKVYQFSEEAQVLGLALAGRLNWQAGAFYLNQPTPNDWTQEPAITFGLPLGHGIRGGSRSKALYAQGTYDLSAVLPGLKFTAGARYAQDDSFGFNVLNAAGGSTPVCNVPAPGCTVTNLSTESRAPTWNFGLDYQVVPDTLLYLTASRGYRPGGGNALVAQQPKYNPEYVNEEEIGIKSDWQAGSARLHTNADFYYQNYSDIQVQGTVIGANGEPVPSTTNAAAAVITGAEFEFRAQLTDALELGATYNYLNRRYTEFGPGVNAALLTETTTLGGPRNSYSLNGRYRLPLPSEVGSVSLQANWSWQGAFAGMFYVATADPGNGDIIEAHGLLNLTEVEPMTLKPQILRRLMSKYWVSMIGCLLLVACALAQAERRPSDSVESLAETGVTGGAVDPEWVRTSQYVTVRDGTRLAIDIYRPLSAGKAVDQRMPVVLSATPYLRAADKDGKIIPGFLDQPLFEALLKRGYIVAILDMRGHGASFGTIYAAGLWGGAESKRWDLYDVIEWLSAQPWSSGKIGMAGCSYLGLTQFWAADAMPPHLKAIVPCGGSYFDEFGGIRTNGIQLAMTGIDKMWRSIDVTDPSPPVDEDRDGALRAAAILEHRVSWDKGLAGMEAKYLVRPFRDTPFPDPNPNDRPDLANEWNFIPNYRTSKIAVMQFTGWRDILPDYTFKWYRSLAAQGVPQKMIIGPWWHCQWYISGLKEVTAEHIRWYDYWLKGIDNGIMADPPIRYYVTGAPAGHEWRTATRWPLPNQRRKSYFLGSAEPGSDSSTGGGMLTHVKPGPAGGHDNYVVNYTTSTEGLPTRFHARRSADQKGFDGDTTQSPIDTDALNANSLTYTTPPLTQDVELTGYPVATLWISSTVKDQDFFVYLEEVTAQGTSTLISEGLMRASGRATRQAPFENEGLPWHSGLMEDQAPLSPGVPAKIEFALFPAANYILKGHRLRLTINNYDKGFDTPEIRPAPTVSIYHDALHPSSISLPFIGASGSYR